MNTYLSNIILRQETYSPATTKGSELIFKELDDDIINLMKCIQAINNVIWVPVYNVALIYYQTQLVRHNSLLWEYIDATPSAGKTPGVDAEWSGVSIGRAVGYTYKNNFVDGDLSGGILTIPHNLNSQTIDVVVRDGDSKREFVSDEVVDANNVKIDFGGSISGTYTYSVRKL
jgi:hypothetical protein